MKRILMIATGGTIASKNNGDGLTPALTSRELLDCVPEIAELCRVTTLQPFNLDSTNIGPEHWLEMAEIIERNYSSYDGFVITHAPCYRTPIFCSFLTICSAVYFPSASWQSCSKFSPFL